MVYFRVSEEEFQQFSSLCLQHGARSMSDLVRAALDQLLRQSGDSFEQEVTRRLKQLEVAVDGLKEVVANK